MGMENERSNMNDEKLNTLRDSIKDYGEETAPGEGKKAEYAPVAAPAEESDGRYRGSSDEETDAFDAYVADILAGLENRIKDETAEKEKSPATESEGEYSLGDGELALTEEEPVEEEPAAEEPVEEEPAAEEPAAEEPVEEELAAEEPAAEEPAAEEPAAEEPAAEEPAAEEPAAEEPAAEEPAAEEPVAEEPVEEEPVEEEPAAEEPIPVQAAAPETEMREGDTLLDGEEEVPLPEAKKPAAEDNGEKEGQSRDGCAADAEQGETVQTVAKILPPGTSPLDEIRNRVLQGNAAEDSPLSAILRRQGNVSLHPEWARKKEPTGREAPMSEKDMELLAKLGYEDSVPGAVRGEKTVGDVPKEEAEEDDIFGAPFGWTGAEYTDERQNEDIFKQYKSQYRGVLLRLATTGLCLLLALFSDLLPLWQKVIPGFSALVPETGGVLCLYGTVVLLLSAMLSLRPLCRGLAGLFRARVVPESAGFLMLAVTLLYNGISFFDTASDALLNSPAAAFLFLLTLGECVTLKRERICFSAVSGKAKKYGVRSVAPQKKKLVRDGQVIRLLDERAGEKIHLVQGAETVRAFFAQSAEPPAVYRHVGLTIGLAVLFSVAAGCTELFLRLDTTGLRAAVTTAVFTFQVSLPGSVILTYTLSHLTATEQLARGGCALIGLRAVEKYSEPATLVFDNTDMFKPQRATEITLQGEKDPRRYVRYARLLFAALGGTLGKITTSDLATDFIESYRFKSGTPESGNLKGAAALAAIARERVEILRTFEEGIEAKIDGRVSVLCGTGAFMLQNGIRLPGEPQTQTGRREQDSCLLYLAFDGNLRLGYEMKYDVSKIFMRTCAQMATEDKEIAILSSDPNINGRYVNRCARAAARVMCISYAPIEVIKRAHPLRENDKGLDSGVIATEEPLKVAWPIHAAHQIRVAWMRANWVHFAAQVAGFLASVVILRVIAPDPIALAPVALLLQAEWGIVEWLLCRNDLWLGIPAAKGGKRTGNRSEKPANIQ